VDVKIDETDVLAAGLEVVFCGLNPAGTAAAAGHKFSICQTARKPTPDWVLIPCPPAAGPCCSIRNSVEALTPWFLLMASD
jgi:hypothetical protein